MKKLLPLLISALFTVTVHAKDPVIAENLPVSVYNAIEQAERVERTEVSDEEIEMLAHLVQAEAGNQTFLGKQLVVDVVLNRMRSMKFPDTIHDVIHEPGQFACSGYYMKKKPSDEDYKAVYTEIESRQNKEVFYFRTEHYGDGTALFPEDDHYFSGL